MSRGGGARRPGRPVRRRSERGSAIVEFIGVGTLVLVPAVYLVLTVADLQAGLFAVESGAREAGRILAGPGGGTRGPGGPAGREGPVADGAGATAWAQAVARAERAVDLAATDQRLSGGADLEVRCAADPCRTPDATVTVVASAQVPLPLVPDALAAHLGTAVTVRAEHLVRVGAYIEGPP